MKKEKKVYNIFRKGFLQGFFAPMTFFTIISELKSNDMNKKIKFKNLEKQTNNSSEVKLNDITLEINKELIKLIKDRYNFLDDHKFLKRQLLYMQVGLTTYNFQIILKSTNSSLSMCEIMEKEKIYIPFEIKALLTEIREIFINISKVKNEKSFNIQAEAWKDVLALQADSFEPYKEMVVIYEKAN